MSAQHDKPTMDENQPLPKKKKLNTLKPPTTQEMNAMRETENLFHSNLFKLQADEMLASIALKQSRIVKIEKWLKDVQDSVTNYSEKHNKSIANLSWLEIQGVRCPYSAHSPNFGKVQDFCFMKPKSINIIGSWAVGLGSECDTCIDMVMEMPDKFLVKDDHRDHKYHLKRAIYISFIATILQKQKSLIKEISFQTFEEDTAQPFLVVRPEGKLNQRLTLRIFASPCSNFEKIEKLHPSQSCYGKDPTPIYNNSILADMKMLEITEHTVQVLSSKKNILNACMLLRLWHRHRQFGSGSGSFSMFVLTQFVVYLAMKGKLQTKMSHYQVLRTIWLQLARSNWTQEGISLSQEKSSSVADAHAFCEVVFMDSTNTVNFCANMSSSTYNWMRWEASLAVGLLNDKSLNSFFALFSNPKPFLLSFDNVVLFRNKGKDDRKGLKSVIEDVTQCLSKGLGKRVKMIAAKTYPSEAWKLNEKPKNDTKFALGFCYSAPEAWEVLDKGPAADHPDSKEFREFWGQKSELRRFLDGFVCEAVHWPANNWAQRRLICRNIASYLLENKLGFKADSFECVADQLDSFLSIPKLYDSISYGTGEEACHAALEALDAISKDLRNLEELPLVISQIQGTAPTFRYAEAFPPLPQVPKGSSKHFGRAHGCLLPTDEMTPMFLPSLKVLLTLETSGKWPDDLEAVRRIKGAFYIQLAERLHKQFQLVTKAFPDRVIAVHSGFVFNLEIAYQRDIALLKRSNDDGIIKYRDNEQSLQLEKNIVVLPRLTAALRGLQAEHPAFSSTVRLVKRWISSHMLLDYFEEVSVELITASLFIHSNMYGIPQELSSTSSKCTIDWIGPMCPQVAFLRFLQMVAFREWKEQLVINFNAALSSEELAEIDATLSARKDSLPPLVLVTPFDQTGVAFTRSKPLVPVWSRLVVLARESLNLLQQQMMDLSNKELDLCQVFRPPLETYDVIIHLKRGMVARRLFSLDAKEMGKKMKALDGNKKTLSLPVYDYEPADCFIDELRTAYGDKARFFYDHYGGTMIGVMWIEKAWNHAEFKVANVNGCCLVAPLSSGEKRLAPNLEAICQDFLILGKGLVKSVQTESFVWKASVYN